MSSQKLFRPTSPSLSPTLTLVRKTSNSLNRKVFWKFCFSEKSFVWFSFFIPTEEHRRTKKRPSLPYSLRNRSKDPHSLQKQSKEQRPSLPAKTKNLFFLETFSLFSAHPPVPLPCVFETEVPNPIPPSLPSPLGVVCLLSISEFRTLFCCLWKLTISKNSIFLIGSTIQ